MTTVAYALGHPRPAVQRGGDCRARDLTQARNVYGPHHFAATTDLRISNGLIRVTIGATGVVPTLTLSVYQGPVTIGDVYPSIYPSPDVYPGSLSAPSWAPAGTVRIDSPAGSPLLTGARLVRVDPEGVAVRLICPVIGDAVIVLRRGERMIRIQHGATNANAVRRVRLLDSPSPVGTAYLSRVEETTAIGGFRRLVASTGAAAADAATFSLSTGLSVRQARFGVGIGTDRARDQPADLHAQLGDASRPTLIVRAA